MRVKTGRVLIGGALIFMVASMATPSIAANGATSPAQQLAPLVDSSVSPFSDESLLDIQGYESAMKLTMENPDVLGGAWFSPSGQLTVGELAATPADVAASVQRAVGPAGQVTFVKYSWSQLTRMQANVVATGSSIENLSAASIDVRHNRVVVNLTSITDAARAGVAKVGDGIVVSATTSPAARVSSGPQQYKDRYPYTGGAAFNKNGASDGLPLCTDAFSMRDSSGNSLQVTAGHCTSPFYVGSYTTAASLAGSSSTSWTNALGSVATYTNSICASTGNSCNRGTTKYGDISAIAVTGNEAYIWVSGPYSTTKAPINTAETSYPYQGESVCSSGAVGGSICGMTVTNNFTSVYVNNGQNVLTPVVQASAAGTLCPTYGDSGGAIYKPVSGINRAVGIQSSITDNNSGVCVYDYFTSIYFAETLYNATVVTQ